MNKKIFVSLFIFITLFLVMSSVSAEENLTEAISLDETSSQTINLEADCDSSILQENSTDDVENRSSTNIVAEDKETYTDLPDNFTVYLKANGTGLAKQSVEVILNKVSYKGITDDEGKFTINFKLKSGNYTVKFFFYGNDDFAPSNGTAQITVKPDIITQINVADKNINYRQGLKSMFQVKLTDVNNKPVAGKTVKITVNGKTYTVKTNSKGIATKYLSLKKGTYKVKYSFSKSGLYLSSSGSYNIIVKPKLSKGNGYWVNKWDMYKIKLKKLSKKGTKHIFLSHGAFQKYGVKKVLKWINKAHKKGIKVHIWMAVFFKNGKFVHPVSKKGVYNFNYINEKIKLAKYYASFKQVDGIHFDYVRFPGNAYKYKNSVEAVNYFIKQATIKVRSVNQNIIVSAAVMPEPSLMKYHYAQDVPTMSKYIDVVIPMVYKGNYHATSKWVKKITNKFVKQSKGSKIWIGLQSYKSDSNIKKLSYKSLFKDAKYAKKGGASGIVLFRWGLSALLNFKKL